MKILSVVSEVFPLIKTGGLADVAGALPKALGAQGIEVVTLVPGYPQVLKRLQGRTEVGTLPDLLGHEARVSRASLNGLNLLILEIPELFERSGGPYICPDGRDHPDNWLRFAVLSLAGACIALGHLPPESADIVHAHDWQTALTPVYLRYRFRSSLPVMFTIHNLAFQGQFSPEIGDRLGLPASAFGIDCLEYYGGIGYLKGGLVTSDVVTTVSPTYAREILAADLGMGLDGVLQARRTVLYGIVNGIDTDIWNPASDPLIPRQYDVRSLSRRHANRAAVLAHVGLPDKGGPVFAALTRLTWQKGADMFAEAAEEIVAHGGQLVVCGQGDPDIEAELRSCAARFPEHVGVHVGYTEHLAHLIVSGCDVLVQPSRFEPCGLTQLYGMRYGAVPLVGRTGGLSETIIDANDAAMARAVATGFQFHPIDAFGLREAIRRACDAYQDRESWINLQRQAMKTDFSWERSAAQYAQLFEAMQAAWATIE
ncbi:glycogen synthase GlgA [Rhizobium sp. RU36D]|uniref:glycogen synthase GlgA n=1 Tax=Rhizobium sp. RU36D TaxID=1907415 RepID=UPI0009D8CA24|nr:glycogen synthase GlgA [Rhizobium sp. RU36D]SMC73269.1 starch synthase [Rhizobium sp. RU36D]